MSTQTEVKKTRTRKPPAPKETAPDLSQLFSAEGRAALLVGQRGWATVATLRQALPALAALNRKYRRFRTYGDVSFDIAVRVLGEAAVPPGDMQPVDFVCGLLIADVAANQAVEVSSFLARKAYSDLNLRAEGWRLMKDIPLPFAELTLGAWLFAYGRGAHASWVCGVPERLEGAAEKGLVELRGATAEKPWVISGRLLQQVKAAGAPCDVPLDDPLGDSAGIEGAVGHYLIA